MMVMIIMMIGIMMIKVMTVMMMMIFSSSSRNVFFVEIEYSKYQYGDKRWFHASVPFFGVLVLEIKGLLTVKLVLNLSLHHIDL